MPDGFNHRPLDGTARDSSGNPLIPGKKNILADQLSRPDQIFPTEWSVFDGICRVFRHPHLELFATRANNKLSLYVSPVPDPLAWKRDALHLPWNHLMAYAFFPFALRAMKSEGLRLLIVAPLWPQKEWFTDLLDLLAAEPFDFLRVWNLLVQPHVRKYHRDLETLRPPDPDTLPWLGGLRLAAVCC